MKGLKKVSDETQTLKGKRSDIYLQLFYDKNDDEVFTVLHCDIGHNEVTTFRDSDIISICNLSKPHSAAEIESYVKDELENIKTYDKILDERYEALKSWE